MEFEVTVFCGKSSLYGALEFFFKSYIFILFILLSASIRMITINFA